MAVGLIILLTVTAVVLFLTRDSKPAGGSPETALDARPLVQTQLGVFTGAEPEKVQAFNAWLGRDVAYVVDFSDRQTWADIAQPQTQIDTWKDLPYRKVYGLALLPEDPADTIERGAAGEYNTYYTELAQRLVAGGQDDAILRLGWEFNLGDSRWATDDPAAFVSYWRQLVTGMRAVPGQHFEFDWNPNNGDTTYDAVSYYPGSDVVDYIGVDAYDVSWASGSYPYPEGCADDACWATSQKVAWDKSIYGGARGLKFWSGFAKQQGKPLSLPEWGLWQRTDGHGGGNDPEYLRRMAAFIADPANRVAYQAYFEYKGDDGPHRLMTTFPQSGRVPVPVRYARAAAALSDLIWAIIQFSLIGLLIASGRTSIFRITLAWAFAALVGAVRACAQPRLLPVLSGEGLPAPPRDSPWPRAWVRSRSGSCSCVRTASRVTSVPLRPPSRPKVA